MAKDNTTTTEATASPVSPGAAQTDFDLSLDEFCTRLSGGDRRVELIAGFHHTELVAGRTKGREAEYQSRYVAFATQPA